MQTSKTKSAAARKRKNRQTPHGPQLVLTLTEDDIDALIRVAHFYERSMGPMRYFVRLTSGHEVRQKFRFIADESLWLERLLLATRQTLAPAAGTLPGDSGPQHPTASLTLTPTALVALWGRLLSGTRTPRARRKAKGRELAIREDLERTFMALARNLWSSEPHLLDTEIASRRPVEAAWMREELSGSPQQVEESLPTP
jgi:hypothetical protein